MSDVAKPTSADAAKPAAPQRSKAELHADIEKTRADLKATLDAIEFKLNVPKQARHAAHRLKSSINRFRAQNPVGFTAAAVGAVAAVGAAAVLGFRFASKK
ncbi:DUF3618 domain-containing protein [Herbiconiux daphne]|uniref:DUF3618 domain-containing protein n=1 Tax=Herbiconiux daphne TaxID=2970914 RepID=A0ABT2H5Y5_9MICO|nr:DUF3618 domain-containing protein [Herbiconiux daphne]MCS5735319.1 DUF3618 domain-containing protein [Herbiconiux daphne]